MEPREPRADPEDIRDLDREIQGRLKVARGLGQIDTEDVLYLLLARIPEWCRHRKFAIDMLNEAFNSRQSVIDRLAELAPPEERLPIRHDPDGTPYTVSKRRPRTNGTTPGETYRNQLRRLGRYILRHYGEEIREGGAVDNAIRILEEHRLDAVSRLAQLGLDPRCERCKQPVISGTCYCPRPGGAT